MTLGAPAADRDQLRRLQTEPDLLTNAVQEMIRWTAPVRRADR